MSDAGRDGTCPVCGAAADVASADRRSVERMAKALGQDAGPAAGAGPSRLARCTACELEFAVPLRAPGPLFYQWLVRAGFTYPAERWEWQACAALLAARAARSAGGCVVMDVGSGDGTFLRRLRAIPNLRAMGLEHQPEVAAKCLDDGLAVAVGDISRLAEVCPEGVDVVTFWHVIEHVDDPVALLAAARDRLREGGELCFSVPLTPMSYEHSWPDPFNEPPHHLTRWNLRALGALTARLGM